jgi:hypothetical protein
MTYIWRKVDKNALLRAHIADLKARHRRAEIAREMEHQVNQALQPNG